MIIKMSGCLGHRVEGRGREPIGKGHEGTFCGDGLIPYFGWWLHRFTQLSKFTEDLKHL